MNKSGKWLIIITIVIVIIVGFFNIKRTPYKVASILTDIKADRKFKNELFEDQWNPNGDGHSLIIFSTSEQQMSLLIQNCIEKGYQRLPISESLPDKTIFKYMNQFDTLGYYYLKTDQSDYRNYCISIVNQTTKKWIIYNVIY